MRAQFVQPHGEWATTLQIAPDVNRPAPKTLSGETKLMDKDERKLREIAGSGGLRAVRDAMRVILTLGEARSEEEFRGNMWDVQQVTQSLRGKGAKEIRDEANRRYSYGRSKAAKEQGEG
jgi:hypothetical protein